MQVLKKLKYGNNLRDATAEEIATARTTVKNYSHNQKLIN